MNTAEYISLKEGGFRPYVYDDATGLRVVPGYTMVGHPTVATGRALDTAGVSRAENDLMLGNDIAEATLDLHMLLQTAFDEAPEPRKAALVSMRFQLGPKGFREFHEMIEAIRLGDWPGAGQEALQSRWARETPSRAQEQAKMLETAQWPGKVA